MVTIVDINPQWAVTQKKQQQKQQPKHLIKIEKGRKNGCQGYSDDVEPDAEYWY